jgi:hypothetical protein
VPKAEGRRHQSGVQVPSADTTALNPPIAAALAAMLAPLQQQQQRAGQSPAGAPPAAAAALSPHLPLRGAVPPPAVGPLGLPPTAGSLRSPAIPASLGNGMSSMLPGGTLKMVQHAQQQGAGGAAELARMGSAGGIADMARMNSGGVGQKNLTLEDLQVGLAGLAGRAREELGWLRQRGSASRGAAGWEGAS